MTDSRKTVSGEVYVTLAFHFSNDFDELEGPILLMVKALYGTKTGGPCWQ